MANDNLSNLSTSLQTKLEKCERNSCIMKELFEANLLPIENAKFLYSSPKEIEETKLSKLEGMLLGEAIGDILGSTLEGEDPMTKASLAPITSFHPKAHFTDDTQFTFMKLEVLLNEGWFNPEALARRYIEEWIIGIGSATKAFIKKFKDLKYPWFLSGVESSGNGALMSLSPIIVPHLKKPSNELWCDAVVTTRIIYWDRLAISSSVSFTNLLWKIFSMNKAPNEEWWINEYVKVAREIEGDNSKYASRSDYPYEGPAWQFVEEVLTKAVNEKMSTYELSELVGSGAYLLETIPVSLYILMQHASDPVSALSDAVTYAEDADTVGAIVGYFVGALNGIEAFPEHLVKPLIKGNLPFAEGKLPKRYLNLIKECEKRF